MPTDAPANPPVSDPQAHRPAPRPAAESPGALRRILRRLAGKERPQEASSASDAPGSPEAAALRSMLTDLLADRRADRRSKLIRALLYFLMFAGPVLLYASIYAHTTGWRLGPAGDVVGVVRLHGEMGRGSMASADRVIPALRKAFESPRVRAVVLSVDSPGGAPLEAERIYSAIESFRRSHPKPVVSVIANQGTSAAYMVALHTDRIYAGQYSLVGSIGAILSGWDAHQALQRVGVSQRMYASGELKAMMNPYAAMTPEADRKAKELVEQMGAAFRAELAKARADVLDGGVDFGSGGVWGGSEAHRLGLVDELSTIESVIHKQWAHLGVHDFGPNAPGVPFFGAAASAAASDWVAGVLRSVLGSMRLQ